jgi:hypothetical protein
MPVSLPANRPARKTKSTNSGIKIILEVIPKPSEGGLQYSQAEPWQGSF